MTINSIELSNSNGRIRGRLVGSMGTPRGCLVCLHGGPGGDLHGNTGVFDQIAERVAPLGFATLQFSVYGSPTSEGHPRDTCLRTQLVDYDSILNFARKNVAAPIHVVGESAGATIASMHWLDDAKSYSLLWPAFDLRDTDLRPYLTGEWWSVVNRDGFLEDNGVVIGRELFTELMLTDFAPSFRLPPADVFLAHGTCDQEVPFSQSLRALSNVQGRTFFLADHRADHGFKDTVCRTALLDALEFWFKTQ